MEEGHSPRANPEHLSYRKKPPWLEQEAGGGRLREGAEAEEAVSSRFMTTL